MFGLAIRYVGMSIAYGISMGLAAAMGSLIPLFRIPNIGSNPAVPYIIVGVFVMVIGVAVLTMAGVQREKTQNAEGKEIVGITRGKLFKVGLIFAILNGIFAALLNVGFTLASPAADAAISQGALPRNASLVQWVIVLFGGFIINLLYTLYLLIKNRSYQTYFSNGAYKGYFWSILTAVLWFAALGVYGQGSAIMGKLGPVIGWTMFLALSLVISNLWGIGAGEWKDMHKPFKVLMLGNAVLIVSWIILGYSQYIMTKAA